MQVDYAFFVASSRGEPGIVSRSWGQAIDKPGQDFYLSTPQDFIRCLSFVQDFRCHLVIRGRMPWVTHPEYYLTSMGVAISSDRNANEEALSSQRFFLRNHEKFST